MLRCFQRRRRQLVEPWREIWTDNMGKTKEKPKTVYMDGVFDLFHIGHMDAFKQMRKIGTNVIIGVVSDNDAQAYKRKPIIPEHERCEIIRNCSLINEVIFPAPLKVTPAFLKERGIDIVVHAFANQADMDAQKEFFKGIPLTRINYSTRTSTSHILSKIISRDL
jgi:cytidyltransferase-like protein